MQTNFITLELAIELHRKLSSLNLQSFQKDQLQRASLSVALNLSEGAARFTANEKRKFYRIAFGSLREVQTIIKIAGIQDDSILKLSDKTAANLYRLLKAVELNCNS